MAQGRYIKDLPYAKIVEHFLLTNMGVLALQVQSATSPIVRKLLL